MRFPPFSKSKKAVSKPKRTAGREAGIKSKISSNELIAVFSILLQTSLIIFSRFGRKSILNPERGEISPVPILSAFFFDK